MGGSIQWRLALRVSKTDLAGLDQTLKSWVDGVVKSLPAGGVVRFDPNSAVK